MTRETRLLKVKLIDIIKKCDVAIRCDNLAIKVQKAMGLYSWYNRLYLAKLPDIDEDKQDKFYVNAEAHEHRAKYSDIQSKRSDANNGLQDIKSKATTWLLDIGVPMEEIKSATVVRNIT